MVAGNFKSDEEFSKEYKYGIKNISMHWHDVYELDIVISGNGETVCNSKSFPVKRGLVSLLSPMDFHEYKNCEDVELICVKFAEVEIDCDLLNNFTDMKTNVIYTDEKTLNVMETLCDLLENLSSAKYNKKIIECLIIAFLGCCSQNIKREFESEIIQKAVMYINAHFRENPKMSDVAQMLYLNETYFCRLFKKCVGMSYKEYIKKSKLDYGLKLVKYTDLSVTDVALNCGYETQSHFNREFKKRFNTSPTRLRKEVFGGDEKNS